jgi:hypothetical protein
LANIIRLGGRKGKDKFLQGKGKDFGTGAYADEGAFFNSIWADRFNVSFT